MENEGKEMSGGERVKRVEKRIFMLIEKYDGFQSVYFPHM